MPETVTRYHCRVCEWYGMYCTATGTGIAPDRTEHPLCAYHLNDSDARYTRRTEIPGLSVESYTLTRQPKT